MSIISLKREGWRASSLFLIVFGAAFFPGCSSGTKLEIKAVDKGTVNSVAFSPDGKLLASGGSGVGIKLWDTEKGELKRTLEGHQYGTEALAFSPDGRRLVSGGEKVRLWDVASGSLIREMDEQKRLADSLSVQDVAFSPDGKSVASAGDHLIIWDVETGEPIRKFESGSYVVALSPDGKNIASATSSIVKLFDIETGELRFELTQSTDYARIHALAFSPDGKLLASASGGIVSDLRVWDAETGALKQTLTPYDIKEGFGLEATAFSPDGRLLASGNGYKGTVTVWDTKNWELKATFKNVGLYAAITKGGAIEAIAFSPDSQTIASGDVDGMVKFWDLSGLK